MPPTSPYKNSYWVKPGQLLAGEYPGSKGIIEAREKVTKFLEAGVTFFLDLTEPHELNPYLPMLLEEAATRGLVVQHRRMSIKDGSIPKTPQEMVKILDTIDEAIAAGHTVYLHCWGGIGRTGTVVGCYLVRHGLNGAEALQKIAQLWHNMEKRYRQPRSPETDEQAEYVRSWSEIEL
jgi:protein-tyrosine phosphatase